MRTLLSLVAVLLAAPALAAPPGLAPDPPPRSRSGAEAPVAPLPPPPPLPPAPPFAEEVLLQEAQLLAVIAEQDPGRHAELLALKQADPRAYLRELTRISRQVDRYRTDPAFAERARRMRELHEELRVEAQRVRGLAEKERKAAIAEMEVKVAELFEAKQAERRARLLELKDRIEELEAEIDQREADRRKIVDDYVEQLLRDRIDL